MGNDDIFHRRKQRTEKSLKRENAKRAPYDRVLIVCEGEKTEPYYFSELREDLKLSIHNVIICGHQCGSDPLSVVNYALEHYKSDNEFNRVYCVFDRDKHPNYVMALDKIKRARMKKGSILLAATSSPCFEIWILLHYQYTTKQYSAIDKKSICDMVIGDVKKIKNFSQYEKKSKDTYHYTKSEIENAIKHAKQLDKHSAEIQDDATHTKVYALVEYLYTLKK